MNEFEKNITAEALESLPLFIHEHPIHLIDTPDALHQMCTKLNQESLLGFDTESRPAFKKGVNHGVSLIQLSTTTDSYLVRNKLTGFSKELIALLENEGILKIGLSLKDDLRELRKTVHFTANGFIDLQGYVQGFGIDDLSLKKIAAIVLKQRISKRQQLSNWEKEVLDESQQVYAAIDSLAPLLIYNKLKLSKKI